jgi:hypothetical protein
LLDSREVSRAGEVSGVRKEEGEASGVA